jgi:hypothetical protein
MSRETMKINFSKSLAMILLMGGFTSMAHADLVCVNTSGTGCIKPVVPVKLAPVGEVVTDASKPAAVASPSVANATTQAPVDSHAAAAPAAAPAAPIASTATVDVAPKKAMGRWEIRAGDLSIYSALKRWSDEAGWQLSWEIPVDYPVSIVGSFDNNFRGAVDSVIEAYRDSDYAPKGCFYENNVLRIVRRVGDGKECLVSGQ